MALGYTTVWHSLLWHHEIKPEFPGRVIKGSQIFAQTDFRIFLTLLTLWHPRMHGTVRLVAKVVEFKAGLQRLEELFAK